MRRLTEFTRLVVRAGGSVAVSSDGHLKVFDRSGRFVVKMRRHRGNDGSGDDRRVKRSVLRQVTRGG